MTLTEAIKVLERTREKHGNVEVYFDCPSCEQSFTPTTVAKVAAHVKGVEPNREVEQ